MQQKGVVHRDLKIGNTFIDSEMQIKIGDFGLAYAFRDSHERRASFCGTPNYMAPEVCRNRERIDATRQGRHPIPAPSFYHLPVDIWALGIIMFNLLFGKSPFNLGDTPQNYHNIKCASFTFPPSRQISEQA